MRIENSVPPFLKWAGGKRWAARLIADLLYGEGRYVEPFLGSGAVFFARRPNHAVLSDVNPLLISAFTAVRDDPETLILRLGRLRINRTTYCRMKQFRPRTKVGCAVQLIYLNRTAFNGLFRVNRDGEFNVPFGCKDKTKLCDRDVIRACSAVLHGATLETTDFRIILTRTAPTDLIYIDPPYTVKHDNNGFRRYNERIFSWRDQVELASALNLRADQGAKIVVSNSLHSEVAALYPAKHFVAVEAHRASCMAATAASRGPCKELLLVSRFIADSGMLKAVLAAHNSEARVSSRFEFR